MRKGEPNTSRGLTIRLSNNFRGPDLPHATSAAGSAHCRPAPHSTICWSNAAPAGGGYAL